MYILLFASWEFDSQCSPFFHSLPNDVIEDFLYYKEDVGCQWASLFDPSLHYEFLAWGTIEVHRCPCIAI